MGAFQTAYDKEMFSFNFEGYQGQGIFEAVMQNDALTSKHWGCIGMVINRSATIGVPTVRTEFVIYFEERKKSHALLTSK